MEGLKYQRTLMKESRLSRIRVHWVDAWVEWSLYVPVRVSDWRSFFFALAMGVLGNILWVSAVLLFFFDGFSYWLLMVDIIRRAMDGFSFPLNGTVPRFHMNSECKKMFDFNTNLTRARTLPLPTQNLQLTFTILPFSFATIPPLSPPLKNNHSSS